VQRPRHLADIEAELLGGLPGDLAQHQVRGELCPVLGYPPHRVRRLRGGQQIRQQLVLVAGPGH
jgi:hypothetical protein